MKDRDIGPSQKRLHHLMVLGWRVLMALQRNPPAWLSNRALDDSGITCEICADAAWWPANGFSEADRQDFCGPDGLDCP